MLFLMRKKDMFTTALRLICLSIVLCMCGCIQMTVPQSNAVIPSMSHAVLAARLMQLTSWNAQGALSIQYDGKSSIANYSWAQHNARTYDIHIDSALNVYTLQLIGNDHGVTLIKNNVIVARANTPEGILQKTMGWSLPISNLMYWYRGLPVPSLANHVSYDASGALKTLSQDGWQIQFSNYQVARNLIVPRVMTLARDGMRVKIVTKAFDAGIANAPNN
jgi:outer membrane lipoprotein LolB